MTPEYKFNIEGLVNKERIVGGLMDSGYVVSVKKRFNDLYEISIYGKERVDGKGLKASDFFNKDAQTTPAIVTTPHTNTWVKSGISTTSIAYDAISCDPKFLVETPEQKERNQQTVINAIQRDHGC